MLRAACTFGRVEHAVRVNLALELGQQTASRWLGRGRPIMDTSPALSRCNASDQNAVIG